jgi:hypothetical protein
MPSTYMNLLYRPQMSLKRSATRRLKWLIPKPEELWDQGLYLVGALLSGVFVGTAFGTCCYWVGARIPAYLNFTGAGVCTVVLLLVPKCNTYEHISTGMHFGVHLCMHCVCAYVFE